MAPGQWLMRSAERWIPRIGTSLARASGPLESGRGRVTTGGSPRFDAPWQSRCRALRGVAAWSARGRPGLTGRATDGTLPLVGNRLSRLLRMSTAVVVIASFVAWRPAMTACIAAMPHGMDHAAHHHGGPQHHALPIDCCSSCICACAAMPGLATPAATIAWHGALEYASPADAQVASIVVAASHRLPFAIGPPPHLA